MSIHVRTDERRDATAAYATGSTPNAETCGDRRVVRRGMVLDDSITQPALYAEIDPQT
jgi:hypothetical protein